MADNGDNNQQQGSNGVDPQDSSGPKGKPDENQKAKRESLEQRVKDLEAELEASKQREQTLNTSLEKALTEEDINAAVKAAQEEAKAASDKAASDWAAREKNLTVTNALLAAGCTDTVALIAHLDMSEIEVAKDGHISGLDTAKLAETYPYLFQETNTSQTTKTLSSAASPGGSGKKITKEEIIKTKDPQKRRQLISENMDLFE